MIALVSLALAADVLVYAPEGGPLPGGVAPVEVAVLDEGKPISGARVTISPATGAVTSSDGEVAPGRYRFGYSAASPPDEVTFEVRVDGESVQRSVPFDRPPPPAFGAANEVEAVVGIPRLELRFPRVAGQPGGALSARSSEGRVIEVREEGGSAVVVVEPGSERQARVMAVALVDGGAPRQTPAFGLVRLRAHPQMTLTADPGSNVTVRVGKRTYGPFVADAAGGANVAFDVMPGENSYEVVVSDDLGNTSRSQGPLPGVTRPVLVGVDAALPGRRGAELYLAAWTPTGQPWAGDAPVCRSGAGARGEAAVVTRGVYRYVVETPDSGGVLFDPRVECALADANVAFRVPLGAERPDRVELRVYPDALSADFPLAQVQAALLDRRGERVAPTGLVVKAEVGELQLELVDGALRGEYRGAAAVERGGDTLSATWDHPAGTGQPWALDLHAAAQDSQLVVLARVRDAEDRPLAGVPVVARVDALRQEATSDARGWARLTFPVNPAVPAVVRASTRGLSRAAAFLPGAPEVLPDPAAPDLSVRVPLPIRAGRVRQVFLDVSPRPLLTGGGATGLVTIRMLDAAGVPVRDEPVQIAASEGTVGPATPREDGSLEARYSPPSGTSDRTVRITATTSAGTVSTDLQLSPRPVNGAVSVGGGWISNFGSVSGPMAQLAWNQQIPRLPRLLSTRVGVSMYQLRASAPDQAIDIAATVLPVDFGVTVTQRWGARSLYTGLSLIVAPYVLDADYGDTKVAGAALASPGLGVHGGGAWRLGGSEIYAEARFLLFGASGEQVTFQGSLGGASLSAGYRLLY